MKKYKCMKCKAIKNVPNTFRGEVLCDKCKKVDTYIDGDGMGAYETKTIMRKIK